ncbi:MAG TPA: hypothetical protein ENK36_04950 [Desulfobacterales bacterium]|nr:hypothetical protein [Desulfobacterales bacterium]
MANSTDSITLKTFKKNKVMDIEQLVKLMNCSIPTVRRRLKQWRTYTSYNKNGSYYVLEGVAEFDKNGLWRYGDILFSKYGNLKKTVLHLVNSSQAGLTGGQISELVGLCSRSFLSHFRNVLRREKFAGQFVYFSFDEECFIRQQQVRKEIVMHSNRTKLPTDTHAVIILVEWIKHPDLSIEELSNRLGKKGHRIKPEIIRNFFEYHGLLKKNQDMQQ